MKQGRYAEAGFKFRQIVSVHRRWDRLREMLTISLVNQANLDAAANEMEPYLAPRPDASGYAALGKFLSIQGQTERPKIYFRKAIVLNPNIPFVKLILWGRKAASTEDNYCPTTVKNFFAARMQIATRERSFLPR